MKRNLLNICLLFAFSLLFLPIDIARAASTEPQAFLPISCDRAKGNYRPMTTMVIVPLDNTIVMSAGADATETAKALFFDLAYVRGNNVAPLNAISYKGALTYLSCPYPDYLANVVTADDTGYFVLGVVGALPTKEVQALVDKLKISTFRKAEFVSVADEKNTTVALANMTECGEFCTGLKTNKDGFAKREYKITTQEPTFSKSVRQKELVSFSIKVKNESEFPMYSDAANALVLTALSKGISPLYHSSWLAPSIIARIPGMLLPGEETSIPATLSAPLLPGKYTETLALKIGNVVVGKSLPISFTVENDNYKLGKIISKDGAAFANLRETPSLKGTVVGRLDVNTYVIIKGYQDAWIKIETKEGRTGWVYKPFISERVK